MAGYPAHENTAKMLENLKAALEKAGYGYKAKIQKIIENWTPSRITAPSCGPQKQQKLPRRAWLIPKS